ncbi:seryl-tRNA ligase [Nitritalea halalkaliphila LW7]|uniref:Serine--tRNA ligase n=1 Tax=Nitritalea halalkaliphila LW7 TaxID=1189621 RepID=I5C7R5_9BACT|nr:seryl-tRNA ligase [Nitritalea halalkaliphila LW7]
MLVVATIREDFQAVLAGLEKRHFPDAAATLERVLALDKERRETQVQRDALQSEAKASSKQIGQLMQSGQREEAEKLKARMGEIKQQVKELEEAFASADQALTALLYTLPNVPHTSVPAGRSAEDNEEVYRHGDLPVLGEEKVAHWDLIKTYDIIDFELGTKITGAGFPVYKGKGARLQRALINFFLDQAAEAGYGELQVPILVNEASGYGTGQLPDKEGQMYEATADQLYLIPTAEVPITNIFRDVILEKGQLPIRQAGYTPCFRREAGSWGAHVRGLNRLHQFDKVEIVQICAPEDSYAALEQMSAHVQGLLQQLELPYRVLRLCGGDMGFTSALTYDMEVYSAAQERWLEVSSVSNFETYQANRLKLRYRDAENKIALAHTLNGSAWRYHGS